MSRTTQVSCVPLGLRRVGWPGQTVANSDLMVSPVSCVVPDSGGLVHKLVHTGHSQIRSYGRTVQTYPGVTVLWGDVPGLSSSVGSWPRDRLIGARGGHGPLRPELAAALGVWPSSQQTGVLVVVLAGGCQGRCCT